MSTISTAVEPAVDPNDWRTGLPPLTGSMVTLREPRTTDAPALHAALTTEEVSRLISPPSTILVEEWHEAQPVPRPRVIH